MTADAGRLSQAMGNDEFVAAMDRFARSFDSYKGQLPVIPYAYSRTRLFKADGYEIVVMQWAPGSTSPIHDHGMSRCWVLMVEGTLEVDNYERSDDAAGDGPVVLRETGHLILDCGDLDFRGSPSELHRVHNRTKVPAYSLQLYAAPIETYTVVDAHTRQGRLVTAICDLELV